MYSRFWSVLRVAVVLPFVVVNEDSHWKLARAVLGRLSQTKTAAICFIRDTPSTASRKEKSVQPSTGRSVMNM